MPDSKEASPGPPTRGLGTTMSMRLASSCWVLIAVVVASWSPGKAWARERAEIIPPPADFARLSPLEGAWEGNVVYPMMPHGTANPGKANPRVRATVDWLLNRYHLKIELCHNPKSNCPDAVMIISYDVQKRKYLLYALNNLDPETALYEGRFVNAKTLLFKRTWKNGGVQSHSRLRLTVVSPSTWKILRESDTVPGDYETDLAPEAEYEFDSKTIK
jgi:hypothetical protein